MTEDELPQEVNGLLADDANWAEPAPVETLLGAMRAEPLRPVDDAPRPSGKVVPMTPRQRIRRRRVLAVAAAVVVVAGVAGVVLGSLPDDDGAGREVAMSGTDLAPEASAVATVEETGSGIAIELDVGSLEPAPPGTYYQAWVRGADEAVTIGTFHMRGGDDVVELWAGVELDEYPTLTVTIQTEGAGQESSGQVVLSGQIG